MKRKRPPKPAPPPKRPLTRFAVPAGIALLSFLTILYPLGLAGTMGYWYDELWSVDAVMGSFGRMLQLLNGDVHPPLYHAALWFWVRLFGSGEVATRALSCFALAAAVPVVYLLGRSLELGRWAAAGAAGAVGLCYASATFAVEARPYTFLLTSGTFAAWMVVRADSRWRLLAAWAAGLIAIGTHYAALFFLLPFTLLWAVRERDPKRLAVAGGWLLALAPFFLIIKKQAALFSTYAFVVKPAWNDVRGYLVYAVGDLRGPTIAILGLSVAVGLAAYRKELHRRLWLLTIPAVLLAEVVVSYAVQPVFHIRYLFLLQPWFYLTAAYLIDRLPRPALQAAAAAVLVALVVYSTSRVPISKVEDWRSAADYVKQHRSAETVVTTDGSRFFRVYFRDINVLDESDVAAAQRWIAGHAGERVWLVQARDFTATPVRKALADAATVEQARQFKGSRAMLLHFR